MLELLSLIHDPNFWLHTLMLILWTTRLIASVIFILVVSNFINAHLTGGLGVLKVLNIVLMLS